MCYLLFLLGLPGAREVHGEQEDGSDGWVVARPVLRVVRRRTRCSSSTWSPLLYVAYCERASLRSLKGVARRCSVLRGLPARFRSSSTRSRPLSWSRYGIYENYNRITVANVTRSPLAFVRSLRSSFVDVVGRSLASPRSGALVVGGRSDRRRRTGPREEGPRGGRAADAHRRPGPAVPARHPPLLSRCPAVPRNRPRGGDLRLGVGVARPAAPGDRRRVHAVLRRHLSVRPSAPRRPAAAAGLRRPGRRPSFSPT